MAANCIYFMFAGVAGVWQAWCFDYGADNALTIVLGISIGLPFALASYAHGSIVNKSVGISECPELNRIIVLWVGMPLSLVLGASTMAAETVFMRAVGNGWDNLPHYGLRLLIGESVACMAWAACLLIWLRPRRGLIYRYGLIVFVTLYAGALFAYGFSVVVPRYAPAYFLVTSIVETALSAMIVIFATRKEPVAHV
jgi:hypothetical protein